MPRLATPRRAALSAAALVAVAAVAVGAAYGPSAGPGSDIAVSNRGCARGWKAPRSGTTTFQVTNHTAATEDVQLLTAGTPRVDAEIFTLDPRTTRPVTATLEPGVYQWQCANLDGEIATSLRGRVTGPQVANPTPGYIPVSPDDLDAAGYTYRQSVTESLLALARDTDRLLMLVKSTGNSATTRSQWLVAHLDYERLGAAYDTFGPFDDQINGQPNGLPGGVNDPRFTGFLRVEYALWHEQPAAALLSVTSRLDGYVHSLQKAFPQQLLIATTLPLRTHEILENALQFKLTGETDQGSHTNLATVAANIQGTETTLAAIAPLLATRNPRLLQQAESGLHALSVMDTQYRRPTGWWTAVQSLTTAQRQQLDGATSQLLEVLSEVPDNLRLFAVGSD